MKLIKRRAQGADTYRVWSTHDEAVRPPGEDVAREYERTLDVSLLERAGDERPAVFVVRALSRQERDRALGAMVAARRGGMDSDGLGVVYQGACFDLGVIAVEDAMIDGIYTTLSRDEWDVIPAIVRQEIGGIVDRVTEGLDPDRPT